MRKMVAELRAILVDLTRNKAGLKLGVRNRFQKRQASESLVQNKWLWVVGGVVILFVLFFLARTLSQVPRVASEQKTLELNRIDLIAYTRMLGGVRVDTFVVSRLQPDFVGELRSIDTMMTNRELRDAIARLSKILKKRRSFEQTVIQGYIGVCYNELAQPNAGLKAFQEGLNLLQPKAESQPQVWGWLAFNCGYIFQYYSQPESARGYYESARKVLPELPGYFAGWVLNNLGVALEMCGDTTKAREAYFSAVKYIDTTGTHPERAGLRLKGNIQRVK